MRFLLDANIPYSSIDVFKKFNYDVQHTRNIGLAKVTDKEIIKYVKKNQQVLVTKDLGFANILDYPFKTHHGLIVLRLPFYFTAKQINKALSGFLKSVKEDQIKNSIIIVELGRYRIRK